MERGIGKRLAYGLAWLSAIIAVSCVAIFITALGRLGFDHTYTASLLSSIIFFTSCAVTLWAISMPAQTSPRETMPARSRKRP